MYTSINMLPYTKWLSLPLGTRQKIAAEFNIPKLRSTHVANDQILDDGYNVADIEKYTSVESLQQYLGVKETDIFVLFQMLVDKVEGKVSVQERFDNLPKGGVMAVTKEELEIIRTTPEATPIPTETIKQDPVADEIVKTVDNAFSGTAYGEPVVLSEKNIDKVVKAANPKKKKHGKKSKTNPQN